MLDQINSVSQKTAVALLFAAMWFGGAARADTTVLLAQPSYSDGVAAHFSVTGQYPAYNPYDTWYVHANEAPSDGTYGPTNQSVASLTGLSVPNSYFKYGIIAPGGVQLAGHSAVQVYGPAVGVFIDSDDLAGKAPLKGFDYSMQTTAEYMWSTPVQVFANAGSTLEITFDEQVPTATHGITKGTNAFTKMDDLYVGPGGTRLSVSYGTFTQAYPTSDNVGYDPVSNTVIVAASLVYNPTLINGEYATLQPDSVQVQNLPWTGWRHFHFTTTQAQFAAALAAAEKTAEGLGKTFSLNPADWWLSATHLNAEIHYTPLEQSTLGWSLQNVLVNLNQ